MRVRFSEPVLPEINGLFDLNFDDNICDEYFGDDFRLRQVLNNLVSNAIKYTNTGGVKLVVRLYRENINEIYFDGGNT